MDDLDRRAIEAALGILNTLPQQPENIETAKRVLRYFSREEILSFKSKKTVERPETR